MTKRFLLLITLLLLFLVGVYAQDNANARQAKRMFLEAYHRAYSDNGASMHYRVNIANIYKTEGTIWYKGKKSKYVSKNSLGWNDGVTAYITKEKKKTVEIYNATSKKKSKYEDKFKFEPDNYNYSIANNKDGYLITIKAKKGVDGVKEARVLLDHQTRDPKHLKIKVAFIWANIYISDFKSGRIDDAVFVFPRSQYSNYKLVDKREE